MIHYYNVAKVHLIRDAMYRRRAEECPGCRDDQANQLGHVTDYGAGCLDEFDAMPQQWFQDAYNSLRFDRSRAIVFSISDGAAAVFL